MSSVHLQGVLRQIHGIFAGGFIAGVRFYYVKASTGLLMSIAWDGSKAVGAEQLQNSSRNWAGRAVFLYPKTLP